MAILANRDAISVLLMKVISAGLSIRCYAYAMGANNLLKKKKPSHMQQLQAADCQTTTNSAPDDPRVMVMYLHPCWPYSFPEPRRALDRPRQFNS
jgi:hypothetical protein